LPVRRDYLDLGFTLVLLAVISWTTWEARGWDARSKLFPWAAGIPLLVLLSLQLVKQVRVVAAGAVPAGTRGAESAESDPKRRRTLQIVGWILGFAAMIWAVGFAIGGTLASLLYLKTAARERWPISLAITVGIGIFFWLLINRLYVPFPRGFLLDQLPI
jgi:hypothetical protein